MWLSQEVNMSLHGVACQNITSGENKQINIISTSVSNESVEANAQVLKTWSSQRVHQYVMFSLIKYSY